MTPKMLSLCSQSDLDPAERRLANQQKLKYILAEADVIMKGGRQEDMQ